MTLQPRSRVRILIYLTWTIHNELKLLAPYIHIFKFLRGLQQQLRRRLRKRHLKREFAPLQTLSRLFQLVQFVKCWQIVLELNSERLQSSGKESRCIVSTSSTKREIRHFHVVVVQRRQRNVQKSVMHVQSCCFTNLNLLLFAVLVAVAVVVA